LQIYNIIYVTCYQYSQTITGSAFYDKISPETGRVQKARMKIIYLTHAIYKDDDLYAAICPELDIASCGESIEEADKSLTEAILT
jgi:hypothetical protein